jgi:hypothetical protein
MKRILIILGLIIAALLTMGGCKVETSTSFGLSIKDASLARQSAEGKLVPVEDGVFQRGEKINLVLLNVGKFKKGEDGKHWFDMDIEVKDPNGAIIFSKQGLLGENGHVLIPNDIAASPYGTFTTTTEMETGNYRIKLTVRDKVSGSSASKSKTFTLE